jgi:FkbM family methyltransferase
LSFIKRLIPNNIKQEGKYFLYNILKIPYSRSQVPLEILKWLPKTNPINFIDIGCNAGDFTRSVYGEYKIKKALLIEPVPKLIPTLEANFPDRNIFKIINAAVSDSNSETEFFINHEFDSISSLLKIYNKKDELKHLNIKEPAAIKVKTFTLDHICEDQQLSGIDLLKIDVQGAEHLVLNGGIEALKKTKLVYTEFSFQPLYDQSSVFFDLYNFFYAHGFILASISSGFSSAEGELLQGDALFVNKSLLID